MRRFSLRNGGAMLGIKYAIIALVSYFILALIVYPLTKEIIIAGLSVGTWLLLFICPVYLIQALYFIKKTETLEGKE
jgi:hypothetical protein